MKMSLYSFVREAQRVSNAAIGQCFQREDRTMLKAILRIYVDVISIVTLQPRPRPGEIDPKRI